MSRASLYIRYSDGAVRYGVYDGTGDNCLPFIEDSPTTAWERYYNNDYDFTADITGAEPVEIATDYGSGYAWTGTATNTQLATGFCPYGEARQDGSWIIEPPEIRRPLPDWAKPSRDITERPESPGTQKVAVLTNSPKKEDQQ